MSKTVFLDRDGTIIVDKHYLRNPDDVELIPDAGLSLARLKRAGYQIIVVSNQSGVGRGFFTEIDVMLVNTRIDNLLFDYGARIDAYYYCLHNPDDSSTCSCRKPSDGLYRQALSKFKIDLSKSWMIGDKMSDINFALKLGITPILVQTGYGKEVQVGCDLVCESIKEASLVILDGK